MNCPNRLTSDFRNLVSRIPVEAHRIKETHNSFVMISTAKVFHSRYCLYTSFVPMREHGLAG
jgi:hypothetical protein